MSPATVSTLSGISLSNVDKVDPPSTRLVAFIDEQTGGKVDSKHARGMFAMDFPWAEIIRIWSTNKTVVRGIWAPLLQDSRKRPYAEEASTSSSPTAASKFVFLGDETA